MKINYKRSGARAIRWALENYLLIFEDGALRLDLNELAGATPVFLAISEDEEGRLVPGPGVRYVAELRIPAKTWHTEKIGFTDDFGYPALRKVWDPVDPDEAELTLWPAKENSDEF